MKKEKKKSILIIVDDESFRDSIVSILNQDYTIKSKNTAKAGAKSLDEELPDLILVDINLPDMSGVEFLKINPEIPDIPIIVVTAVDSIPKVVEAIKLGAYDYLTKPVDPERLHLTVARALESFETKRELERHRNLQFDMNKPYRLLGESQSMQNIRKEIEVLSKTDSTVLISGDTGTGKEVVAREIHALSYRANEAFVAINCGAIPKDLIESELYGHKGGAFTGAQKEIGKFRLADGGTLLLDEVSELPIKSQTKLLRVLQDFEFYPVGSTELIHVNVRVLASTNKDLTEMVKKGTFREDLYYRLNVYTIEIPPLNERPEDIITLSHHFIKMNNLKFGKNFKEISPEAEKILVDHQWKGNVRELQNVIERIHLFEEDTVIRAEHLEFMNTLKKAKPSTKEKFTALPETGLDAELDSIEKKIILQALEQTKWNKSKAARLLRLSRPAFEYRLEKHKLN